MNWRQQQKAELKQQLYDNAIKFFESQGFEATTVAQITTELGVAKGTFFNHFPTKEHVIERWYNDITTRCLEAARKRLVDTAEQAVADLFADMSGRATASPALLMAKSGNVHNPLLLSAEKIQVGQVSEFIGEQCRKGQQLGQIRADVNVTFLTELLIAVLAGTSRAWIYSEPRFSFPDLIRERVRFVFQAAQ